MTPSNKNIILVTGGSRGIGAAICLQAAQKGYMVCVNFRSNQAAAHKVVEQIIVEGGAAHAIQADVAVESDIVEMFKKIDSLEGKLTALVNNAGILDTQMQVAEMSADRINRILTTNVTGSFICAREAIKRMSNSKGGNGGAIVNISSVASRTGSPNEYIDYAASKGAIDSMTIGLAKELASEGIRVNCVRPGLIHTEIHASGGEADRIERLKEKIPLQRGGLPNEIASAVIWLLSPEAAYTTGALLDVTGGI